MVACLEDPIYRLKLPSINVFQVMLERRRVAPNTRRSPIDVRHQPWPSLAQAQPHKGRGDKVVRLLGSDGSLVMFQWG